jgi:hypothetical protein
MQSLANIITSATSLDPIGDILWNPNSTSSEQVDYSDSLIDEDLDIDGVYFYFRGNLNDIRSVSRLFSTFVGSLSNTILETRGNLLPVPIISANSTTQIAQALNGRVEQEIYKVFALANDVVFEDGMETEFSRALISLIETYSEDEIELLSELLLSEKFNVEDTSEALRWIGDMESATTKRARRKLLEHNLSYPSARVRDSAALGLSYMNDPQAIPALSEAIEKEEYDELKTDMSQVLEELKKTR